MDEIYSTKLEHGRRSFYFDIKEADNKSIYLTITERKFVDRSCNISQINILPTDLPGFKDYFEATIKHFNELLSKLPQTDAAKTIQNAGTDLIAMPWSDEEDERLHTLYNQGTKIRDLAVIFSRSSGAIYSRLKKLSIL
jgi:hypothetical protein